MNVKLAITTASNRIAESLGHGGSFNSIVTSSLFAMISFFYVYTVASSLRVDIYFLQNRITYYTFFHNSVINRYFDGIVIACGLAVWLLLSVVIRGRERGWLFVPMTYGLLTLISVSMHFAILLDLLALVSVPLAMLLLVYNRYVIPVKKFLRKGIMRFYVNYLALIGAIIACLSIVITIFTPFYYSYPSPVTIIGIPNYFHSLFVLISSASPLLIFLLVFCFPVKLVVNEFMTKVLKMGKAVNFILETERVKRHRNITFLLFFSLLSVAIAAIPHSATINRTNQYVGTDSPFYVNLMDKLVQTRNPNEFILKVFTLATDRPLSTLFLFTVNKVIPEPPSYTIDRMPIILSPLLVLTFYFLTRELTSNDTASLMAAFLTAISSHTLIGIYAGFYANWIGIIIGYLSFVFLIRFLKTEHNVNFTIYSGLVVLLLFTHVYTWTIFTIVASIFLVVLFKLKFYNRRKIIFLLIVVSSSVVIDAARASITGSAGGIESDLALSKGPGAVGLGQFTQRWSNLVYTTQVYLGGQLSNPIILLLGLYWLFRSKLLEQSTIFLMIFLSLGLLPLFVGNVLIQGRVLYDIPFQIPCAIALTYITRKPNGTFLLLSIVTWLMAMSLNAVSNFYLIPP